MAYQMLRRARPGLWEGAADAFAAMVDRVRDPSVWTGAAQAAAEPQMADTLTVMYRLEDDLRNEPPRACQDYAGALRVGQTNLSSWERRAAADGLRVGGDGAVSVPADSASARSADATARLIRQYT